MDTFWITFGNDFGEGYKPDFRIHFDKPEQDEGYQCIKVCRYEVVEKLETENARYREALKSVLESEVLRNAPFVGYSEAVANAREALKGE
jgi:hypothetical protein